MKGQEEDESLRIGFVTIWLAHGRHNPWEGRLTRKVQGFRQGKCLFWGRFKAARGEATKRERLCAGTAGMRVPIGTSVTNLRVASTAVGVNQRLIMSRMLLRCRGYARESKWSIVSSTESIRKSFNTYRHSGFEKMRRF